MKPKLEQWFRFYAHPLTISDGQQEYPCLGMVFHQNEENRLFQYPEPYPVGNVNHGNLLSYFLYQGAPPQAKPIILVDHWHRYQVEQLEYIELFQCWRAALREGTGWNN